MQRKITIAVEKTLPAESAVGSERNKDALCAAAALLLLAECSGSGQP